MNRRDSARVLSLLLALMLVRFSYAAEPAPPAYVWAARTTGVPTSVLYAIALQESGMAVRGRFVPWPWTLHVAGTALRFQTSRAACSALRQALIETAPTRIDVGLMQLNVGFQGHRVNDVCQLLDPYRNLRLGGVILREQRAHGADWGTAIARYHRPGGGEPALRYRRRVEERLVAMLGTPAATSTLTRTTP